MTQKIEIIGGGIIGLKNFKKKADKRLVDLESTSKNFIQLDYFRSQFQTYEDRLRDYVDTQLTDI